MGQWAPTIPSGATRCISVAEYQRVLDYDSHNSRMSYLPTIKISQMILQPVIRNCSSNPFLLVWKSDYWYDFTSLLIGENNRLNRLYSS